MKIGLVGGGKSTLVPHLGQVHTPRPPSPFHIGRSNARILRGAEVMRVLVDARETFVAGLGPVEEDVVAVGVIGGAVEFRVAVWVGVG